MDNGKARAALDRDSERVNFCRARSFPNISLKFFQRSAWIQVSVELHKSAPRKRLEKCKKSSKRQGIFE